MFPNNYFLPDSKMKRGKARYKELADEVFEQPDLFFRKAKIVRGWIVPEIDMKALAYYLNTGIGKAYIVAVGVKDRIREISKEKVQVILKRGDREGEAIIRLEQGQRWFESDSYTAEKMRGADATPLLFQAARAGLVIPLSVTKEIQKEIQLWIERREEA